MKSYVVQQLHVLNIVAFHITSMTIFKLSTETNIDFLRRTESEISVYSEESINHFHNTETIFCYVPDRSRVFRACFALVFAGPFSRSTAICRALYSFGFLMDIVISRTMDAESLQLHEMSSSYSGGRALPWTSYMNSPTCGSRNIIWHLLSPSRNGKN